MRLKNGYYPSLCHFFSGFQDFHDLHRMMRIIIYEDEILHLEYVKPPLYVMEPLQALFYHGCFYARIERYRYGHERVLHVMPSRYIKLKNTQLFAPVDDGKALLEPLKMHVVSVYVV